MSAGNLICLKNLLNNGTREEILEWLQSDDPNGTYSDEASEAAGMPVASLDDARQCLRRAISGVTLAYMTDYADDAMPRSDNDWGTPRQIDAENRFYALAKQAIDPEQWIEFQQWALKATAEERIERACELAVKHPREV